MMTGLIYCIRFFFNDFFVFLLRLHLEVILEPQPGLCNSARDCYRGLLLSYVCSGFYILVSSVSADESLCHG